jgi:hypothetical protein
MATLDGLYIGAKPVLHTFGCYYPRMWQVRGFFGPGRGNEEDYAPKRRALG